MVSALRSSEGLSSCAAPGALHATVTRSADSVRKCIAVRCSRFSLPSNLRPQSLALAYIRLPGGIKGFSRRLPNPNRHRHHRLPRPAQALLDGQGSLVVQQAVIPLLPLEDHLAREEDD